MQSRRSAEENEGPGNLLSGSNVDDARETSMRLTDVEL